MEFFQSIMQHFHQSFGVCGANQGHQSLLFWQLLCFSYRLLRRIFSKSNLSVEEYWNSINCFDFIGWSFLAIADVLWRKVIFELQHCVFWRRVWMWRGRSQKEKPVLKLLQPLMWMKHWHPIWNLLKFTWCSYVKSDRVKGRARFDYSVLFLLPKEKTASCCGCVFNSFSASGWLARELKTLHSQEFIDLVDDLRYTYIDDDSHSPAVGDMVTFICGCPEMCSKEKKLTMFRLSCLRIGQFPPVLPSVLYLVLLVSQPVVRCYLKSTNQ